MFRIKGLIRSSDLPAEYHKNFTHLYADMGWFGVLSGSSLAFLSVYAARLGANSFQIGLLGAMPAVINLFFAIPASQWLQNRTIGRAVFWTSVFYRFGYLLLIPLPWLFGNDHQIWVLILLALLMGIPGTALAVGFNALFAEAVPEQWRAHVAGTRNILLSIVYVITSIGCGAILNHVPFPIGYQIVFGIGFLGAAMSSYHLFFIRSLAGSKSQGSVEEAITIENNESRPTRFKIFKQIRLSSLRMDILQTPFRRTLLVLLFFHLAQYLTIPLFPMYFVNVLHLNDQQIGIGTASFYLTVLIGSSQLARLCNKIGLRKVTGIGVSLMSLYPILLSYSSGFLQYLVISLVGGFSWALVGGALANYLLEKIPNQDRTAYLAWYNIILNAAILAGSLLGSSIGERIGLGTALFIFGIVRLVSGLAILKWG